jgi:hypothetical protein
MNTDTLLVIIVALIPGILFYFLVKAFEKGGLTNCCYCKILRNPSILAKKTWERRCFLVR